MKKSCFLSFRTNPMLKRTPWLQLSNSSVPSPCPERSWGSTKCSSRLIPAPAACDSVACRHHGWEKRFEVEVVFLQSVFLQVWSPERTDQFSPPEAASVASQWEGWEGLRGFNIVWEKINHGRNDGLHCFENEKREIKTVHCEGALVTTWSQSRWAVGMENLKEEERIKATKGQRFQVPKRDPHSFHLRTHQKFLYVAQVAVSSLSMYGLRAY